VKYESFIFIVESEARVITDCLLKTESKCGQSSSRGLKLKVRKILETA